jgi:protein ImuB
MRRVASVWLPTWPTDRLRRQRRVADVPPPGSPLITATHDGRRRVVAAADSAAQALGLRPGQPIARAQALVPGLAVAEADPAGDEAALGRLAAWCLRRYAPLTAPDPPDGVWLDVTGCAHLWQSDALSWHAGEEAMLDDLVGRLARSGIAARCAVADTPGAAWAVARHAGQAAAVVPPGGQADALAPLPVAALRLPEDDAAGLCRLGLDRLGQLAFLPRAPLARRFGPELLLRLDQALGRVFELISPHFPPELVQHRLAFPEPLLTAEAFAPAISRLALAVCAKLELAGQGARRLALLFERVDGHVQAVRVGTAKPSRDARHLGRMLDERLEEVDPGLGVESMRLVVLLAETLPWSQAENAALMPGGATPPAATADVSALVHRLANRLGEGRVFRVALVESDVPERSARPVPPLAPPTGAGWLPSLPRPARLLDPPQPVRVMALLPNHPPAAFTWRRVRRRVRRADGPERITGEWWRGDGEAGAVRDYWAVEDEEGQRYWLYRRGDGADPSTGDLGWFLHGLF